MHPIHAFETAYDVYPVTETPFLQRQKQRVLRAQPYKGLKILHNVPLTAEILFKIEVLGGGRGRNSPLPAPHLCAPSPMH